MSSENEKILFFQTGGAIDHTWISDLTSAGKIVVILDYDEVSKEMLLSQLEKATVVLFVGHHHNVPLTERVMKEVSDIVANEIDSKPLMINICSERSRPAFISSMMQYPKVLLELRPKVGQMKFSSILTNWIPKQKE